MKAKNKQTVTSLSAVASLSVNTQVDEDDNGHLSFGGNFIAIPFMMIEKPSGRPRVGDHVVVQPMPNDATLHHYERLYTADQVSEVMTSAAIGLGVGVARLMSNGMKRKEFIALMGAMAATEAPVDDVTNTLLSMYEDVVKGLNPAPVEIDTVRGKNKLEDRPDPSEQIVNAQIVRFLNDGTPPHMAKGYTVSDLVDLLFGKNGQKPSDHKTRES